MEGFLPCVVLLRMMSCHFFCELALRIYISRLAKWR